MTNQEGLSSGDFGEFIVDIREECIRNIDSLLNSERSDIFSLNAKKLFSEVVSGSKSSREDFIPLIVDEVIIILLQRFDKEVLKDGNMDIVYGPQQPYMLLNDSIYKSTDSLGMDYMEDWLTKYASSNFFTEDVSREG